MRQGYTPKQNIVPMAVYHQAPRENVSKPRGGLLAKFRLFVMLGCIGWALWTYMFVQLPHMHQLNREAEKLSNQILSMQKQQANLQKQVTNLNQDSYIEQIVRDNYNMVKQGDVLYQPSSNK